MRNGLHCKNAATQDPNYVVIGNTDLIDRRSHRVVAVAPGGVLSEVDWLLSQEGMAPTVSAVREGLHHPQSRPCYPPGFPG
ncbi:hypothetical protein AGMMS49543_03620 [Betaproteobacteria bacterium]|nr:hypothetical protein AGMMS49543_03620 [Betaproteobacteria bacterium]GHU17783.1 hypothetical protein AGMMS50243_06590 [Betaproteobacteria bacterium]